MPELPQVHPEVTWAQRSSASDAERNYLYVNIKAPDVPRSDATLNITATNVSFAGPSKKGVQYQVSLDLFGEIEPENSKVNHSDREVELVLRKKELKEEFWPRLLKTTQKIHFLKTDFDKWVDEDEQDEAQDEDYANNFGGFDGLDQGGLGNIDFSKLGAGLGAQGGAGGAEEGESDDEEMPELEEADQKGDKIQEVA
ncbi:Hsp90 binding co-chaperone (Sba1) [Aspergillus rambellii]|uniref:Hsp90 binding co-chaperone (Sba1) n=1 Tax=Aspergillus rambellii TaxID=308745 RepID=A0A0F8UJC5_9EURO|nr:Hsp90 binding co-chaperone (Sba1) [Aspergillus rambellii]